MAKARLDRRFRSAVRDLAAWLDETKSPGVVVGGLAVAILGRPRITQDVDAVVLIDEDAWEPFVEAGRRFGFWPRAANPFEFARVSRVLLLKHKPTNIDVDISLGALAFEHEMIARSTPVKAGGVRIPLPCVEDLITMKALARRGKDVVDIEGLLDANPTLDRRRVLEQVRAMAEALDSPDILEDLQKLFSANPDARGSIPLE